MYKPFDKRFVAITCVVAVVAEVISRALGGRRQRAAAAAAKKILYENDQSKSARFFCT
jgi:hypothetical protein